MLTHWYGNSTFFRLLTRLTRNLLGALSLPVETANLQTCLGSLHVSYVLGDIFPSLVLYPDVNEFFAFMALLSVSHHVSRHIISFFREAGGKFWGSVVFSASFMICKTPWDRLFFAVEGWGGCESGNFLLIPFFSYSSLMISSPSHYPQLVLYLILSDGKIGDVWRCPQI